MTEKKTRKATAAERLAARALGRPEPDDITEETMSSGERHYARILERQRAARSAKGSASPGWDGWGSEDPPAA